MTDEAAQELDVVKRLLVVLLMKLGATSDEIGLALNVSGRRVRQMFPSGQIGKADFVKTE